MSENPFAIRMSCLDLAAKIHPTAPDDILLTATKFYNFVNGDFAAIPDLADKIKLVPRKEPINLAKMSIHINDENFEQRVIERVAQDPSRVVFYIDVEKMTPEQVAEQLDDYKDKIDALRELQDLKKMAGVNGGVSYEVIKEQQIEEKVLKEQMDVERAKVCKLAGVGPELDDLERTLGELSKELKEIASPETAVDVGNYVRHPLFDIADDRIVEIHHTPANITEVVKYVISKACVEGTNCVLVGSTAELNQMLTNFVVDKRNQVTGTDVDPDMSVMRFLSGGSITTTADLVNVKIKGNEIIVRSATVSTQPVANHYGKIIHLIDFGAVSGYRS